MLGERVLAHFGGKLDGKRIAIWGLAFKPETDDIRESPALVLLEQLRGAGATVVGYDPAAMPNIKRRRSATTIELVKDAVRRRRRRRRARARHRVARAPRSRSRRGSRPTMRTPVLFDGRNVWPSADAREAGLHLLRHRPPVVRSRDAGPAVRHGGGARRDSASDRRGARACARQRHRDRWPGGHIIRARARHRARRYACDRGQLGHRCAARDPARTRGHARRRGRDLAAHVLRHRWQRRAARRAHRVRRHR